MRSKTVWGLLFVLALAVGALTTATYASTARSAVVNYDYPVHVGNAVLFGRCLIVHDDAKMAAGEPCTSIYSLAPDGKRTLITSFHCVPATRSRASVFTTAVGHGLGSTTYRLVEYQFAGETEAHGVPGNLR